MNQKVSIIVPCYNSEKYIKDTVLSCLNQNYSNKEILIIDNESTDNSLNIIKQLKNDFPNLIIDSEKNIYKYSWQEPVEKAIKLMTGDLFTIVGSDDILSSTYISNCVDFLNKSNSEIIQSDLLCFSKFENNTLIVDSILGHRYNNLQEFKNKLLLYCCVTTPTVMYKKDILTKYKFEYRSDLYLGSNDYYCHCLLADQGVCITPANKWLGYFYRTHEKQSSRQMINLGSKLFQIENSFKSYFRDRWKTL